MHLYVFIQMTLLFQQKLNVSYKLKFSINVLRMDIFV